LAYMMPKLGELVADTVYSNGQQLCAELVDTVKHHLVGGPGPAQHYLRPQHLTNRCLQTLNGSISRQRASIAPRKLRRLFSCTRRMPPLLTLTLLLPQPGATVQRAESSVKAILTLCTMPSVSSSIRYSSRLVSSKTSSSEHSFSPLLSCRYRRQSCTSS
jgi:hypothetical protein